MTYHTENIAGIVLSGGEGRRLGGVDKGLSAYKGQTLIEHVIKRIRPQTKEIIICANRNVGRYESLGYPVVQDTSFEDKESFQGPLAGLVAAISFLQTKPDISAMLVCSCDCPFVPNDHAAALTLATGEEHNCALVHDGERKQNLHCLIKRNAWPSLVDFFESGGRAMHKWHKKNGSIEVNFSDQAACFKNFNSADSLA